MIDIHCHILDGVDDGAYCLADSVEMAKVAFESGTKHIIATPHANAPGGEDNAWGPLFEEKLLRLNAELKKKRIPVTVHPGQEIFGPRNVPELLKRGSLITLNKSRYVLVEFDFYARIDTLLELSEELYANGYVPVIAHPERYEALKEDDGNAYRLKRRGCLFQINGGSLFGDFGQGAQNTAHGLLGDLLVDFVASDAHGPFERTPYLADVHELISEEYSPDYADFLLRVNPGLVLENREIKSDY